MTDLHPRSNVVPFKPRSTPDPVRPILEASKRVQALRHRQETMRFYMACGLLIIAGLAFNGAIVLWAAGAFR